MRPSSLLVGALGLGLLAGCDRVFGGTQIGVEHGLECTEVSREVLTDLDAVPDRFVASPQELIDGLVGDFVGEGQDEEEQPTGVAVALTVSDLSGDVELVTYESNIDNEDGDLDLSHICQPAIFVDLGFAMETEALPRFDGTLNVRISGEGEAWVQSQDESDFEEPLPEPSTFDPDDFDTFYSEVRFSGFEGLWWTYVSLEAYDTSEMASDGDVPITAEYLLIASLTAE